jgi:hypothetical protein
MQYAMLVGLQLWNHSLRTVQAQRFGSIVGTTAPELGVKRRIEIASLIAETLYKNDLRSLLQLSRLQRGLSTSGVPETLGVVMGECRDAWRTTGPLWLVDDRARAAQLRGTPCDRAGHRGADRLVRQSSTRQARRSAHDDR